jgi:hypothetical protein
MALLGADGLRAIDQPARPDAFDAGRLTIEQTKPLGAPVASRAYEPRPKATAGEAYHPDADPVFDAVVVEPEKRRLRVPSDMPSATKVDARTAGRSSTMSFMSVRIKPSGRMCLIVWAPVLAAQAAERLADGGRASSDAAPPPPARRRAQHSTRVGALGARWGRCPPTPKASKTSAFRLTKRRLGVFGVKIDRYVVEGTIPGTWEGAGVCRRPREVGS